MLRLALTPGEPAGIGPDLAVMLAQTQREQVLVAYADPDLLHARAQLLGLPLTIRPAHESACSPGTLAVYPVPAAADVTPGRLNPHNAGYVLDTLRLALTDTLAGQCQGLVTGPVHKGVINDAGIPFSGHTEFFAEQTQTPRVVMMLATQGLKVALATTHLPLRDVPDAIDSNGLIGIITLLHRELQDSFGLHSPRIAVCGLNPHAGENGHMGREEIDIIAPALSQAQAMGIRVTGPHPADTLFTPGNLAHCDVVLAMYHDQGLPVLKYKGFGAAVNITLGLPFIRTSVDHGTALDLAGTGNIDTGSLDTAIAHAASMAAHRISS